MADEDQGQWTGTRQHPRSAVRSRHSLEPPREMQWHHKDAASGDPGTGNHQALGNAGIKRYFRVREPRPRGGGGVSSEPVHSTTPPPGTRFSVSRARLVLRRRIGDAAPARRSQALWASFPSGALGPHSCFSSVPWGMQTGPTGTDGISKVSPLLPPQSPTRRDMVETEQIGANASVSARNPGAAGHRRPGCVPHGSADRRSRGPGRGW